MSRIPNAVAFVVAIGLAVTFVSAVTAPAGGRGIALVAGLITTVIFGIVVAIAFWVWSRSHRDERPD